MAWASNVKKNSIKIRHYNIFIFYQDRQVNIYHVKYYNKNKCTFRICISISKKYNINI